MKHLKSFIILITLILMTGPAHSDETIVFNWALLYRQGTDEAKGVKLKKYSITLRSGDEIKVYLHPLENSYIYIFLLDTSENLYLIFPGRISFFNLYYKYNTTYSFPRGTEWAPLDNTKGTEEIILIASSTRLEKLEKLTISYNNLLFKKESNDLQCAEARCRVLEEIQRLKHEHSQFTRKAKEMLIKVAVEIRATEEKQEIPMVQIKAHTFYTKTIRIRH